MSKSLDALKNIKYIHDTECGFDKSFDGECKLIEKALKEHEQQDSALKTLRDTISLGYIPPKISIDNDRMEFVGSVGLKISETLNKAKTDLIRNWILRTCFPDELKALEIIKDKQVNVQYLEYFFIKGNGGYTEYKWAMKFEYKDYYPSRYMLTKDEFDLLKRVLK